MRLKHKKIFHNAIGDCQSVRHSLKPLFTYTVKPVPNRFMKKFHRL